MKTHKDCALLCSLVFASACGAPTTAIGERTGGPCVPNMSVTCACVGGAVGVQVCIADGTYEACRCERAFDAGRSVDAPSVVDQPEELGGVGGALAECPAALVAPLAVSATVSCDYQCHGTRSPGLDYVAPMGSVVHSPVDGTVITAVNDSPARPTNARAGVSDCAQRAGLGLCCGSGFGNHVVIKDRQGRLWYLGHMQPGSVVVDRGAVVRAGQAVGRLGNSGNTCSSTGGDAAHVHLSVRVGGDWADFTACPMGAPAGVAAPACRDEDLDTYGVGAGCDAEDCDDRESSHQSWNRTHAACLGAEEGGSACADRDGDGSFAGASCSAPDADCDDFDRAVTTGCRRCVGAACTPAPVGPRCGDGSCNGTDTCASCPVDCGACPARCGDGTCNAAESCSTCPADCGSCPASVCPCFSGDGAYCGSSAASQGTSRGCTIPVATGNGGNLLRCSGGVWSLQQTCTAGCNVAPAGTNDSCATARPTCPCFSGNGAYCGSSAASLAASRGCVIPVAAGNLGNLLRCSGGAWTLQQACARGCYVAPPGSDDRCN